MQFTVDYIYKNIDIWESSKQRQDSDCIKPTTDDKVKSPNGIPPQPSGSKHNFEHRVLKWNGCPLSRC